MAQGPQTRCAGCGRFISARPDWDDYSAEERAYVTEWEEHACEADWDATAGWAPRPGERDAYLASLAGDQVDELEPDELEPVALAPSVAAATRIITINAEEEASDNLPAMRMLAETSKRAVAPVHAVRLVHPAEAVNGGQQLAAFARTDGPERQHSRIRPADWPTGPVVPVSPRSAAGPTRDGATSVPLEGMGGHGSRGAPRPDSRGGLDAHTRPASPRTRPAQTTSRGSTPGLPGIGQGAERRGTSSQAGRYASSRGLPASWGQPVHHQPARRRSRPLTAALWAAAVAVLAVVSPLVAPFPQ